MSTRNLTVSGKGLIGLRGVCAGFGPILRGLLDWILEGTLTGSWRERVVALGCATRVRGQGKVAQLLEHPYHRHFRQAG